MFTMNFGRHALFLLSMSGNAGTIAGGYLALIDSAKSFSKVNKFTCPLSVYDSFRFLIPLLLFTSFSIFDGGHLEFMQCFNDGFICSPLVTEDVIQIVNVYWPYGYVIFVHCRFKSPLPHFKLAFVFFLIFRIFFFHI